MYSLIKKAHEPERNIMAFMDQEKKKKLAPAIRRVLKAYGMKGTLAVQHHSTLICNVKSGEIDFSQDHTQVNTYHINNNYEGIQRKFLSDLKEAMMAGNFDNSDLMTDYFHVGWYISINIGNWNKPYQLAA